MMVSMVIGVVHLKMATYSQLEHVVRDFMLGWSINNWYAMRIPFETIMRGFLIIYNPSFITN